MVTMPLSLLDKLSGFKYLSHLSLLRGKYTQAGGPEQDMAGPRRDIPEGLLRTSVDISDRVIRYRGRHR